jgi:hypothetical protein
MTGDFVLLISDSGRLSGFGSGVYGQDEQLCYPTLSPIARRRSFDCVQERKGWGTQHFVNTRIENPLGTL